MEESLKNRIILILVLLTVIFFIGMVFSCTNAQRQKSIRDKEMFIRLDSEEKLNKATQEKIALENKLNSLSKQLQEEMANHEADRLALVESQDLNKELKEELEKISKLKDTLEEDLKEALVKKGTNSPNQ